MKTVLLAFRSLKMYPLRSTLSILGVSTGVASVIWLVAIGNGMSRAAQRQIEQMGVTTVILRSVPPNEEVEDIGGNLYAKYGLLRSDHTALVDAIPSIQSSQKIRETDREVAAQAGQLVLGHLVACTPELKNPLRLTLDSGRFLCGLDLSGRARVCVLSREIASTLFPVEDPIGRMIWIRDIPYTVVGVATRQRTSITD